MNHSLSADGTPEGAQEPAAHREQPQRSVPPDGRAELPSTPQPVPGAAAVAPALPTLGRRADPLPHTSALLSACALSCLSCLLLPRLCCLPWSFLRAHCASLGRAGSRRASVWHLAKAPLAQFAVLMVAQVPGTLQQSSGDFLGWTMTSCVLQSSDQAS